MADFDEVIDGLLGRPAMEFANAAEVAPLGFDGRGLGGGSGGSGGGGGIGSSVGKLVKKGLDKLFASSATPKADAFLASSLGTGGTGGAHIGGFTEFLGAEAAAADPSLATPGIQDVIAATESRGGMGLGTNPFIGGAKTGGFTPASPGTLTSVKGPPAFAQTSTGSAASASAPASSSGLGAGSVAQVAGPVLAYAWLKHLQNNKEGWRRGRQNEFLEAKRTGALDTSMASEEGPVNILGSADDGAYWLSLDDGNAQALNFLLQGFDGATGGAKVDDQGRPMIKVRPESFEYLQEFLDERTQDPGFDFFRSAPSRLDHIGGGDYDLSPLASAPEGVEYTVTGSGQVIPLRARTSNSTGRQ